MYIELNWTYVLLVTGSVGVLVSLRGEEIHVGDAVEEGLVELSSDASLRGGGEGLSGGDESDRNDGGSLHDGIFLEIMKKGEALAPRRKGAVSISTKKLGSE